ncbi:hypothetical protein [Paraburkholderia youngii]|uniref:Uncharacterized protein n=1 Tax=Paraburkholderia youngii TaxID=2782701 RepID=A0A7Y6MXW2_9BURK|nr:hypothetical protein [Paraburkholderia youngii]NUX98834.1 hypothetical protein [Paraburkholderia youngii]
MTKNRNTFEAYQENKQSNREKLITEFLKHLKQSRAKYPHVTALASAVSGHIALSQGRPCDQATILRNKRYRMLLVSHLATQAGREVAYASLQSDAEKDAALVSAQLESANLRRDNSRLRTYVASLECAAQQPVASAERDGKQGGAGSRLAAEQLQIDLAKTCQALHTLLRYSERLIHFDSEKKEIVDRSKLRGNVIVEQRLLGPFISWLKVDHDIA